MSYFEITKQNILNPIKYFLATTVEAGLMSFSYNGKNFKIVEEEKPMTQGQRLAEKLHRNREEKGVNYEAVDPEIYKQNVKGMNYERWSK